MSCIRKFQFSCDHFWGYANDIDISQFSDLDAVISYMKRQLRRILISNNLQVLAEKLDTKEFHMHTPDCGFDEIRYKTRPNETLYLCSHCS